MEALARRYLRKPLEITVGGRSVVNRDVSQIVEILDEDAKFLRLLEILGEWYDEEKDQRMLIFVDRQEAADNLLKELFRRGYRCSSIHGGHDQSDRQSTINSFKAGDCQILTATSVAARGLDVKELNVVINYECPNHMEDYVHRVGRTGRAGRKGKAYTFISHDEERFAPDVMQALKMSGTEIPEPLQRMVDAFMEKVKSGEAKMPSSGFGGRGLERIAQEREMVKKTQKQMYGDEDEEESEVEDEFDDADVESAPRPKAVAPAQTAESKSSSAKPVHIPVKPDGKLDVSSVVARINAKLSGTTESEHYSAEIEINELPQKARHKLCHRETLTHINESTGAVLTTRGVYIPPGRSVRPGERKLYLLIEAKSQKTIDLAKAELKRALMEIKSEIDPRTLQSFGRYSVM
jgi:ATP-dependent RNA helicase DDX46/PRP5